VARLLADENFPLPVVEELRRLGHDVVTLEDAGKAGQSLPDEAVLDFASGDNRAVLKAGVLSSEESEVRSQKSEVTLTYLSLLLLTSYPLLLTSYQQSQVMSEIPVLNDRRMC
jgi:hypothetical protein